MSRQPVPKPMRLELTIVPCGSVDSAELDEGHARLKIIEPTLTVDIATHLDGAAAAYLYREIARLAGAAKPLCEAQHAKHAEEKHAIGEVRTHSTLN